MAEFAKLGEVGYEVTIVSSIREGSDEARKKDPDLVLLDGRLVKVNNYDGFYQLKLEFPLSHIPTIMWVAQEELEEFQKKLDGFDSYCFKPFNYIDLLGHIRMVLQRN